MTYHIHTQDCPNLADIVSHHFSNASIWRGVGLWRNTQEPAAMIEVITSDRLAVNALAAELLAVNRQEAVMLNISPSVTETITSDDGPAPELHANLIASAWPRPLPSPAIHAELTHASDRVSFLPVHPKTPPTSSPFAPDPSIGHDYLT